MVKLFWELLNKPKQPVTPAESKKGFRLSSSVTLVFLQPARKRGINAEISNRFMVKFLQK
jgi:hypothetical protein